MMGDLSDKITEILRIRRMIPAELADKSGVPRSVVSDILNRVTADPRQSTVQRLADALGVSANYFYEENTVGPEALLGHLSEKDREFVLSEQGIPWIKISQKAAEQGIPSEVMDKIVQAILDTRPGGSKE